MWLRCRSLLVVASLFALPLLADAARTSPVDAHFARSDEDGLAHVHITLNSEDVTSVQVEVFDEAGESLQTYTVNTKDNGRARKSVSLKFAPALDPKIHSARVTGFTRSSGTSRLFDTGVLKANPMLSCAGQCSYTRIMCNNDCFLAGCTSAFYECADHGAGCEWTCICLQCP